MILDRAANKKILTALYIVSMTVAFTTRYGDLVLGYRLQIAIGIVWTVFGFLNIGVNGFRVKGKFALYWGWFIRLYLVPHIIIHLYTVTLMIIGKVSWDYLTTNFSVYIPVLLVMVSIYLFGTKALKYNIIAIILSWSLSVLSSLLVKGVAIIPHAIIKAFVDVYESYGGMTSNYFELHDIVLSIGYLLAYYIFAKVKYTRRNLVVLAATLLIMIMGLKRISVLAIILILIFHLMIKHLRGQMQLRICKIAGWMGFFACFLFIYVVSNESVFADLMNFYDINTMGRTYYYHAVMSYAEFKPSFLGLGRNMVSHILSSKFSYLRVSGVHSDIIKMYVENGFILFAIWLWYYLIHVVDRYKARFGNKAAIMYFGTAMYTFSLYVTDNIEIYFVCQIFSLLIPICYALENDSMYACNSDLGG